VDKIELSSKNINTIKGEVMSHTFEEKLGLDVADINYVHVHKYVNGNVHYMINGNEDFKSANIVQINLREFINIVSSWDIEISNLEKVQNAMELFDL